MNKEFKVVFKRSFKLVDNGDLTQNLHSLTFQNCILINEFDFGNIADILIRNKQQETNWKELKKYLEEEIKQNTPNAKWKHYNEDGFNDYDIENPSCIEMQPINVTLKDILNKMEKLESGNNE